MIPLRNLESSLSDSQVDFATLPLKTELSRVSLKFKCLEIQALFEREIELCSRKLFKYFTLLKLSIQLAVVIFFAYGFAVFGNRIDEQIGTNLAITKSACAFLILDFSFISLNFFSFSNYQHSLVRSIFYVYLVVALLFLIVGVPFNLPSSTLGMFALGSNTMFLPLVIGVPLDISIIEIAVLNIVNESIVIFQLMISYDLEIAVKYFGVGYSSALTILSVTTSYYFLLHRRQSFVNIFNLKKQEKHREEEKMRLHEEIIHQKGKYIAQVAHDLGTPLQAFSLAIELLQGFPITSEMEGILATAECAVELMTVTRTEALNHAKHMEGLDVLPCFRQVDLRNILSKCALIMNGFSGAAELPLSFYLDPHVPDRVFTDYEWIWVMITNLLSNAKKYSSRGEIQTTVHVLKTSGFFRVEVLDDGIGVPDNRKGSLFKPFGQIMKAAGGTGLGLHGVLLKAKKLGGRVGIRDNPTSTSGSIFWFEVPFKQAISETDLGMDKANNETKEFLSKKDGTRLRRVLVLGIDKSNDSLDDSFQYLTERGVLLDFYPDHRHFLEQARTLHRNETDIIYPSELDARTSKQPIPAEKEEVLWMKCGEHTTERLFIKAISKSSHEAGCVCTPPASSKLKVLFSSSSKLKTSIHNTAPRKQSSSKASVEEKWVPQQHQPCHNSCEMGFDAVFWVLFNDQLLNLDADEKCSLFELVKSKANQNMEKNPFFCVVLLQRALPLQQISSGPLESDHKSRMFKLPMASSSRFLLPKMPTTFSFSKTKILASSSSLFHESVRGDREGQSISESEQRFKSMSSLLKTPSTKSFKKILGSSSSSFHESVRGDREGQSISESEQRFKSMSSLLKTPSTKSNKSETKRKSLAERILITARPLIQSKVESTSEDQDRLPQQNSAAPSGDSGLGSPSNFTENEIMIHYSDTVVNGQVSSVTFTKETEHTAACLKKCDFDMVLERRLHSLDIANILLINVINTDNRNSFFCKPLSVEPDEEKNSVGEFVKPEEGESRSASLQSNSILLVDDDKSILKFTKKMLEVSGYTVVTERNGFDALNSLEQNFYKVAIVDRNMPVMDGLECVRRFRRWEELALDDGMRTARQKILIFSANADQINIEESIQAGADAFLGKPVKIPILIQHIEDLNSPSLRRKARHFSEQFSDDSSHCSNQLDLSSSAEKNSRNAKTRFIIPIKEGLAKLRNGLSLPLKTDNLMPTSRRTARSARKLNCELSSSRVQLYAETLSSKPTSRRSRVKSDASESSWSATPLTENSKRLLSRSRKNGSADSTPQSEERPRLVSPKIRPRTLDSSGEDFPVRLVAPEGEKPAAAKTGISVSETVLVQHMSSSDLDHGYTCKETQSPNASLLESLQRHVLVVDDDATIRCFTSRMLTKHGYAVNTAENGQVGLSALQLKYYDVAIVDRNMPVMDGVECVTRFRQWECNEMASFRRTEKQKIFMCTGGNVEDDLIEKKLIDLFLQKPIKMKVLIEEIDHITSC